MHVVGRKSETAQHRVDLQIDAVAFIPSEAFLELAVPAEHLRVLGLRNRVVGEPLLEMQNLRAHVEQRLERQPRFGHQCPPAVVQAVLRQVADREARGLDHVAAVGFLQAGEHLQERRLASPVGAAQSDALTVIDLPADGVQQGAIAERLAQDRELNHG